MTEETLFELALRTPETERALLLERACEGQPELKARVEALLRANEASSLLPIHLGEGTSAYTADRPLPTENYGDPTARIGLVIAGKYKLIEEIGEGGMGQVFMAQQTEPVKRTVAVKVIKAGMDSKAVLNRFEAERQALAMMDHPNIARVLDAGATKGGRPFFVMELVKGQPITQFCDERKLTPRQRLELFVPVCQAIQHAHQKGVIHRDIKPNNVLVAMYDDKPVPKVIDFGVAKAAGQTLTDKTLLTGFGAVVGTPEYMSPEQVSTNNLDIDTRSDVYSLGVLLYELLTGTTPVDRKSLGKAALMEILRIVREVEAPSPSAKLSTIDTLPSVAANRNTEPAKLSRLMKGELDWVVLKALEKDRSRRYDTANALSRDIQRYLADELVEARPPSTGYRLKKFIRRHRGQVIAASLVLLALFAGVVGTSLGMVRAAAKEKVANDERDRADEEKRTAQKERDRAEGEKQIAQAVRDFLQKNLLGLADTTNQADALLAAGRTSSETELDPRISVLLDRAAAELTPDKIESRFANQPLVQAEILQTIGNTYFGIGKIPQAIAHLARARDLRIARLGADHHDTLVTLSSLAWAYQVSGKLAEAVPLYEQIRDARVAKFGVNHPETLVSINNLAYGYRASGKLAEAVRLYEWTRDAQTVQHGADHPNTLTTLDNLAGAYQASGKRTEAIRLYEKVRDARVARLGTDHPDTLVTLNNLAWAYRSSGKLAEAVRLFEQVRDVQVIKLGADHPHTLATLNNLALAYQASGKLTEAVRLFTQVRDAKVARYGAEHPSTLISLYNLAWFYVDTGNLAAASPLFEEAALGIEKLKYHDENASLIVPSAFGCYEKMKQFDKAEAWRRKWLAHVKDKAGAASPAVASELAGLGLNLLQQKKWSDAESTLRECLAIREKTQPETWATFNIQSLVGAAILGQKKYADAEPMLVKGYVGMKARFDKTPGTDPPRLSILPRLNEALDRLIQLYTETNKPDEVKKWQAEKAKLPTPSPAKP